MSDTFADKWLSDEVKGKLNQYDYDQKKAEDMLTKLGFKRDSDKVWMDDKGKRIEVEFLFQEEFADWSGAAKNACEQLTTFGIKCTGRSITYTQFDARGEQWQIPTGVVGLWFGQPASLLQL